MQGQFLHSINTRLLAWKIMNFYRLGLVLLLQVYLYSNGEYKYYCINYYDYLSIQNSMVKILEIKNAKFT